MLVPGCELLEKMAYYFHTNPCIGHTSILPWIGQGLSSETQGRTGPFPAKSLALVDDMLLKM